MIYIVLIGGILVTVAAGVAASRTAQLKRLAQPLQMRYDHQVEHVLTEDAFQYALFFQQGVHRFFNVLTKQEPGVFMRVCDDRIFASATAAAADQTYTLVTAELTRGKFTPVILMPRRAGQKNLAHPALPADLMQRYVLTAPDDYRFTENVLGFLRAAKPCYLELTPTAFIYHEFDIKPADQIQPLRFRAKQLIAALVQQDETAPAPAAKPAPVAAEPVSDAELQAQMLLKLQAVRQPSPAGQQPAQSGWLVYGFVLLGLLIAVCLFASFALKNWVGK